MSADFREELWQPSWQRGIVAENCKDGSYGLFLSAVTENSKEQGAHRQIFETSVGDRGPGSPFGNGNFPSGRTAKVWTDILRRAPDEIFSLLVYVPQP